MRAAKGGGGERGRGEGGGRVVRLAGGMNRPRACAGGRGRGKSLCHCSVCPEGCTLWPTVAAGPPHAGRPLPHTTAQECAALAPPPLRAPHAMQRRRALADAREGGQNVWGGAAWQQARHAQGSVFRWPKSQCCPCAHPYQATNACYQGVPQPSSFCTKSTRRVCGAWRLCRAEVAGERWQAREQESERAPVPSSAHRGDAQAPDAAGEVRARRAQAAGQSRTRVSWGSRWAAHEYTPNRTAAASPGTRARAAIVTQNLGQPAKSAPEPRRDSLRCCCC